ncbi:hypothetical protein [Paenibacillus glucanolyticus]|uniref:hypothetical protein n=1 Tax=Paenibacillus glucanolyticus TaxID=59843 RepID=UPI0015C3AF71|nr:hypothetical protein [Paenibacillus glucanolyticus]
MKEIDDYNLIDEDFEEFMRRGWESFGLGEDEQVDRCEEKTKISQPTFGGCEHGCRGK